MSSVSPSKQAAKDLSALSRDKQASSEKLTMLTAYDFNTAQALEASGIDSILVGDSLAMVALGYPNTRFVTTDEMLTFVGAVRRGAPNSIIIGDLPYSTAIKDVQGIVEDAKSFIEAGANIVKIEGAEDKVLAVVKELKAIDIPVLGHIGYTPQDIEKFPKGRMVRDREALLQDAKALDKAGVIGIVIELVPSEISKEITESVDAITIGIGAGQECDGQVLVTDDVLGRFTVFKPRFLKAYSNQHDDSIEAFQRFISDVKSLKYPPVE